MKRTIFYNIEIPCHTQNIERMVADMTIAGKSRIGYKRHGKLMMTLKSMESAPKGVRKSDFQPKQP